jgi:hypothetical protein
MLRIFSRFAILLLIGTTIHASDFYVDPEHGDPANDGSAEGPWRSLQDLFTRGLIESRTWDSLPYKRDTRLVPKNAGAPVKAGDTIWLRTGYYGDLAIENYYNKDCITIAAVDAGAADLAPKTDMAGTSRPEGRGVDIGAYELPAE